MRTGQLRWAVHRAACTVGVGLLAAGLTAAARTTDQTAATGGNAGGGHPATYTLTTLPSLGGTASAGSTINNQGQIAGFSALPGDQTIHASVWRGGKLTDLGTLGGPNSAVLWPVNNTRGVVVGIAETAADDPLGEPWSCSAFFPGEPTGKVCRGFVWQDGKMRGLPTLGGTHGFAASVNQRGQVVGWAENTVADPTCVAPQVLQFRGVIWEPDGRVRELVPLPGDTVSTGNAINNRGQVVGISGICDVAVGRFSALHNVLWEDGKPTDIGDLGGDTWHTPMAISDRGEVVGFSNPETVEGGEFLPHAYRWTRKTGIQDLGTLPGADSSQALDVNEHGQIVGVSCGQDCHAVLWEDGAIINLDTLVQDPGGLRLVFANGINDAGVITGQATDPATGESFAIALTPTS